MTKRKKSNKIVFLKEFLLDLSKNAHLLKKWCRSFASSGGKIRDDSRKVKKGDLFAAVHSPKHDVSAFIRSACSKEPRAVIVENQDWVPKSFKGRVFQVSSTRKILPVLLNQYYNSPSEKMFCAGITGTNGKTTTAFLMEHLFSKGGWKTGVIGTVDHHIENEKWPSRLTTPSPIELQERLYDFRQRGAQAVVLEASSIGLDQERTAGVQFNLAVFTNFTQDHLDYHKTMDQYFQSKARLFKGGAGHCRAVLNTDNEKINSFSKVCRMPFISYGQAGRDFQYHIVHTSLDGSEFEIYHQGERYAAFLPLIGGINVENALASLAGVFAGGFSLKKMIPHLKSFKGVPGRLQRIKTRQPVYVFIDYAHTETALLRTLQGLRRSAQPEQNIITVFGCGGDRDTSKRAKMGKAASQYSSKIVVTSDNPRSEDPQSIIQDIVQGAALHSSHVFVCLDRKEGIKKGLELAGADDIVLIAGKGHEKIQIIGNKHIPFDDAEAAQEFL